MEAGVKVPTWFLTSLNGPNVTLLQKTKNVDDLISSLKSLHGGGYGPYINALKGKEVSWLGGKSTLKKNL